MDKELTIIYLKALKRKPSDDEEKEYLEKLVRGEITLNEIENELIVNTEDVLLNNNLNIKYEASLHEIEIEPLLTNLYDGVILSNGKICVKSSQLPNKGSRTEITTSYSADELGSYNNNLIQGFTFTGFNFFNKDSIESSITNLVQRLYTYTAYLEITYDVVNIVDNTILKIKQEQRALRQYPYCFLQRCIITNPSDTETEFELYHINEPSSVNLSNIKYRIDIINEEPILISTGSDITRDVNVFTSSIYLFSNEFTKKSIIGLQDDDGQNMLKLSIPAHTTATLEIITAMMTSSDFSDPLKQLSNILISIKDDNLISDHNKEWISIWNTSNISISKKTDIESNELIEATKSIQLYQRNIKYSLYNIFSIIRNDINVDNNLLNLSVIDRDGEIFWNAEMFLIPILLILNPSYAKVLLDFRYKQMDLAKNIALAYKHKGSQYPYRENIANYKDIFWAPSKPAVAFNTGLIGINTWNYYRVSNDKHWLLEKGFIILKNCARYFQSLFDSNYLLKEVHTISGVDEENNSLTRYLGINTIRYYIESCYITGFNVDIEIFELYNNIKNNLVSLTNSVTISNNIVLPTNVTIKKNIRNGIYLCNTITDEFIGNKFSKFVGRKLLIVDDTQYTFSIDTNVFINFYDSNNIKLNFSDLINHKVMFSSEYGFNDGYIIVLGSKLCSYETETSFESNIFINTDTDITLNNIITRPQSVLNTSKNLLETHMIMMFFYSKSFFNSINPVSKIDIIKDNNIYYKSVDDNLESKLIVSNLDCLLAQEMGVNIEKIYYINKFDNDIENIFNNKDNHLTLPWGNHNNHILFIFNLLTSMFKFRVKGAVSDHRLQIEPFLISREAGYCTMPKYWSYADVIYNKNNIIISNNI